MINAAPHYLLISETCSSNTTREGGRWRFVLESIGGNEKLVVTDSEPNTEGERLQLLTVIRGLEALDQPSHVSLFTPSNYVIRGIRRGLPVWRENNWRWEQFGQMSLIQHADLWQRLDRALAYHTVACRRLISQTQSISPTERTTVQTESLEQIPTSNRHATIAGIRPRTDRFLPLRSWFNNWTRALCLIPNIIL